MKSNSFGLFEDITVSIAILMTLVKWIIRIPKGINHILLFNFPGKAIMKIENRPNNFTPLQGSPIHTPCSKSFPIIFVNHILGLLSVSYPNMFNMKLDCFKNF